MISAQPHKSVQEKLIERLMSTPNEVVSHALSFDIAMELNPSSRCSG